MNRHHGEWKRTKKANPVPIGRVLVPLSDSLGLSSDIQLGQLRKNWPSIVGAPNARNTKPLSLRNGILTISVSSPAWMAQARYYTSTFIGNINGFDPREGAEIREVRFVLERR
jgi:predicted nucleic acid-binding Zn ribbon protein